MNHVFFYIMWTARCVCVVYLGKRWHQDALWEEGKLAESVWCSGKRPAEKPWILAFLWILHWHIPHVVADQIHPFMATVFPDVSGLFQQDNVPCHTANIVEDSGLRNMTKSSRCWLGLQIPRSQSNRASVGCAGKTSPIHGGPTSQLTGLKGSAASILVVLMLGLICVVQTDVSVKVRVTFED